MHEKTDPSEGFLSRNVAQIVQEEVDVAQMMEEGLPPPPNSNPTYFYVYNEDVDDLQEEELGSQDPSPTPPNISIFLRLPQQNPSRPRSTYKPLVDYFQSQILTSDLHVDTLQSIA